MKTGIELIAEERERQISKEGYTPEHDDYHCKGELVDAAINYCEVTLNSPSAAKKSPPPPQWPFEKASWKPSDDPIRNLVKAGALIAAEIDRIQRVEAEAKKEAK